LIVDDEVWLPLSMKEIGDGFMAAWDAAGKKMDDLFASGGEAEFIVLQNAWSSYPPAPFPALGVRIAPPDMAAVSGGVTQVLDQYITREIDPLIQGVQRQIQGGTQAAGLSTAALYNRLGILQTRSGRTADAKASYERAAGMGSVQAMTNRGNMALNENDRAVAERWFRQALQAQPDNAVALRGLEQIDGK
jgi:tetratricopeptide (TPR) repeat protein